MKRRFWTPVEVELLRSMYPECHTDDVAAWLDRSVKSVFMAAITYCVRKSADYLASDCAARMRRGKTSEAIRASQFKPGHGTWNKGKPGSTGLHENCRAMYFRKGSKPQTWLPIGTERVNPDGILQRKVSDTGIKAADWIGVHTLAWVAANGPVPAGRIVVFKRGARTVNRDAITADTVECITHAENMRRNSVHTNYPPEIARLHQLRGALNRQINKRASATEQA